MQKTSDSFTLSEAFCAPQVGLEPRTLRLTAECSAIELLRNIGIRQRPILPGRFQPSTFGTEGLNFCVRDGTGVTPSSLPPETVNLFRCFRTLTTAQDVILSLTLLTFSVVSCFPSRDLFFGLSLTR